MVSFSITSSDDEKKVSDTFRQWTLKKAPTITSLKNRRNSKVSQKKTKDKIKQIHETRILGVLLKANHVEFQIYIGNLFAIVAEISDNEEF